MPTSAIDVGAGGLEGSAFTTVPDHSSIFNAATMLVDTKARPTLPDPLPELPTSAAEEAMLAAVVTLVAGAVLATTFVPNWRRR